MIIPQPGSSLFPPSWIHHIPMYEFVLTVDSVQFGEEIETGDSLTDYTPIFSYSSLSTPAPLGLFLSTSSPRTSSRPSYPSSSLPPSDIPNLHHASSITQGAAARNTSYRVSNVNL